jgi:hypothetical protein
MIRYENIHELSYDLVEEFKNEYRSIGMLPDDPATPPRVDLELANRHRNIDVSWFYYWKAAFLRPI